MALLCFLLDLRNIPPPLLRNLKLDAADRCISIDFVMLESSYILPDTQLLHGLFKRWLEELKDDMEEPLQAIFHFKNAMFGSSNKISCNLVATNNPIMDCFLPCQACRCHGLLTSTTTTAGKQKNWCQVSSHELEPSDIIENSIRIGKDNIIFLPSFGTGSSMERVTSHVSFNVIERTSLGSLDEGAIMGSSYRVYPSSTEDEIGLDASNAPDQYPELSGSEEILPIPDTSSTRDFSVPKEVESSILASLSKIAVKEYNPLEHERGFHAKLNELVKESLQRLAGLEAILPIPDMRQTYL